MVHQVSFSPENNTLHMASSPREKFRTLSQSASNPIVSSALVSEVSFFGYSLYINLLSCVIIPVPTKTKVNISFPQTSKAQTSWSLSPFCWLCKEGEGFEPRLQFWPLFVLSYQQPYQPIRFSTLCLI